MQNMMWAIRTVRMFSGNRTPPGSGKSAVATNIVSNEAPSTISGVAIGRKISTLVAARPRNW